MALPPRNAGRALLDGRRQRAAPAFYLIGELGDSAVAAAVRTTLAECAYTPEVLWGALPALGRAPDRQPETLRVLRAVEAWLSEQIKGDDTVTPHITGRGATEEPPRTRERVLRQMAILALAANDDAAAAKEVRKRLADKGLLAFHPTTWFLVVDVLPHLGDEGVKELRGIVDRRTAPVDLLAQAVRRLAALKKLDAAALRAKSLEGPGMLRAVALQLLTDVDVSKAAETSREIILRFAQESGQIPPEEAYLVSLAAQVGGRVGSAWGDEIVKAAEAAFDLGLVARREGKNEKDITKLKIIQHPAVLEHLLIEAGRSRLRSAVPILLKVLTGQRKQGRAEAALALGSVGGPDAVSALLKALEDRDSWVRFSAYHALRHLSAQDYFCDYVFGTLPAVQASARKYRQWFEKHPPK